MLRIRLFTPEGSASQSTFPLVVCLHGAGECGSDNVQQLNWLPSVLAETRRQRDFSCYILAPQCPANSDWTRYRKRCSADNQTTIAANDLLMCLIQDVLKFSNVDRRRVYLVGFSMGSYGAWDLAAEFPDAFAAVVPIAGGGRTNLAASLVNVPIWTVHGDNDETCPVQQTRDIVDALKAAGAAPSYSELRGIGHEAWKHVFCESDEQLQWMFQQRK